MARYIQTPGGTKTIIESKADMCGDRKIFHVIDENGSLEASFREFNPDIVDCGRIDLIQIYEKPRGLLTLRDIERERDEREYRDFMHEVELKIEEYQRLHNLPKCAICGSPLDSKDQTHAIVNHPEYFRK